MNILKWILKKLNVGMWTGIFILEHAPVVGHHGIYSIKVWLFLMSWVTVQFSRTYSIKKATVTQIVGGTLGIKVYILLG